MYLTEEIWRKLLLFHRGSHDLSSYNRSCPGCCCPACHRRLFFCEEQRHIREMRFSTKPARNHLRLLSRVLFCKWMDIAQMLSVLDDHVRCLQNCFWNCFFYAAVQLFYLQEPDSLTLQSKQCLLLLLNLCNIQCNILCRLKTLSLTYFECKICVRFIAC